MANTARSSMPVEEKMASIPLSRMMYAVPAKKKIRAAGTVIKSVFRGFSVITRIGCLRSRPIPCSVALCFSIREMILSLSCSNSVFSCSPRSTRAGFSFERIRESPLILLFCDSDGGTSISCSPELFELLFPVKRSLNAMIRTPVSLH
jgi:hypothetical protein